MFFRLYWTDPRLAFNSTWRRAIRLKPYIVWRPDIIYYNGIDVSTTAEMLEVTSDGTVLWSRQQLVTLAAGLDLHDFPFDSQQLPINLVSLSYDTADLNLTLFQGQGFFPDPVPTFSSAIWEMTGTSSTSSATRLRQSDPNPYSLASVKFLMIRRFDTYVVKYMLLLGLLVLLSSLSYCIDAGSAPARVACSFILVVALAAFNIYVSNDLPKLSYTTFMDQYVLVCFCFALVSVFEYATVNYFISQSDKSLPPIGRRMDRFFMYTAPPMWALVVSLFISYSPASVLVSVVLWLVWLGVGFRDVARALFYRFRAVAKLCARKKAGEEEEGESMPMEALPK